MIGCDVTAIDAQLGIAIALAEIAVNLVVGAVLFDDNEDMIDA
jgi:hypothetical protein